MTKAENGAARGRLAGFDPDAARLLAVSPFGRVDPGLVAAACRAGALGILDLSRADEADAAIALRAVQQRWRGAFGVRVGTATVNRLPEQVRLLIVDGPSSMDGVQQSGRSVLVEVCSLDEARRAAELGANGVILKGNEAAGRVSEQSSFVFLQAALDALAIDVWVQGGVGLHTAPAIFAAGAAGVVVDSQLSLLRESNLSKDERRFVMEADGSAGASAVVRRRTNGEQARNRTAHDSEPLPDSPARVDIPVSRDLELAQVVARRCTRVREFVRAVLASLRTRPNQARMLAALGPNSAFGHELGLRFPIIQGPMTRVSDCPAFARAVSDAGGLPFVALSEMRGAVARKCIEDAATALRGRPWGVGVLGFLDEETRQEQFALLEETRPPVVLIAGGRPNQAKRLENNGIITFLHVPSPGILDVFIKQGCRRFVFEGRECGGHIGPRTSFVLWELAVERLLQVDDPSTLTVVFAGGIHDARSAAIVSVIVAPLVARGAQFAVLMGTSYLFTEEAVACGAIGPQFQKWAAECEKTAILEIGPGHAIRAANSPFVIEFDAERKALTAAGLDARAIGERLEQMNLGRLRIASKGLRRQGDALVPVGTDDQDREGLFMLGEVATLRRGRVTIENLHRDVAEGSQEFLERSVPNDELQVPHAAQDIAIVGIACMFPGAADREQFWRNTLENRDCVQEVPDDRWNKHTYYDPDGTGEKTPSKWGGFIPQVHFDPDEYGIPPNSLPAIDPAQLLSLHVTHRALLDAGIIPGEADGERIAVIFGADVGGDLSSAYGFRALYSQVHGSVPDALDPYIPKLTEDSFAGALANVVSGRISNRLGFEGSNYAVNAACASSLAAVNACRLELLSGSCDVAIAGAVDLHNGIEDYLLFASARALSPSGRCRSFDSSADGIALGEGVAAIVLKRMSDALSDGDRIYATLKAVGSSSDGKGMGLTAPKKKGQRLAMERAYDAAGFSPSTVEMVEAHGTGTVVGDRTELLALSELMYDAGTQAHHCVLGSVKSQIGHTKCAAGLAGLIRAALAIQRGVLPPTSNLTQPNAAYDPRHSPFVFLDRSRPWLSSRRRAGVSALGFGGTNFHAVLESAPDARVHSADVMPAELFLIRASDQEAARAKLRSLLVWLQSSVDVCLRDLAYTVLMDGSAAAETQVAIVASSLDDLREKLTFAIAGESADGVYAARERAQGKLAFLFPGQGSQYLHMFADLFVWKPELRTWLGEDAGLTDALFPPRAFDDRTRMAQETRLRSTQIAQPAIGTVSMAVAGVLTDFGVDAQMAAGHSYGEITALAYAGCLPAAQLLQISRARADAISNAITSDPGTMAAVACGPEQLLDITGEGSDVVIANLNAPAQTVIAGSTEAMSRALAVLAERQMPHRLLPVACAFHSPVIRGADLLFAHALRDAAVAPPAIPVWSNVTARPHDTEPDTIRKALCAQLVSPVRFAEQVASLYADGARVFVEVGPGSVLTGLVKATLGEQPHWCVTTDARGKSSVHSLLNAVAKLATLGVRVEPKTFFERRGALRLDLERPGARSLGAWIVDGRWARPANAAPETCGFRPLLEPIAAPLSVMPESQLTRADALQAYFDGMSEIVQSHRSIMANYFGAGAALGDTPAPKRAAAALPAGRARANAAVVDTEAVASLPPPRVSGREELINLLVERTGYPATTFKPEIDLEADLGIDSIKRVEIFAQLEMRLGATSKNQASGQLEELAHARNLGEILAWLDRFAPGESEVRRAPVPADPRATLVQLLAERTGYPIETLRDDLDLESDLGIDSIKRIEIVHGFGEVMGLLSTDAGLAAVETLANLRSIGEIIRAVAALQSQPSTAPAELLAGQGVPEHASGNGAARAQVRASAVPEGHHELQRSIFRLVPIAAQRANDKELERRRFLIQSDRLGVAAALAERLRAHKAVVDIDPSDSDSHYDGIIALGALGAPGIERLEGVFLLAKRAISGNADTFLGVTGLGGDFGRSALPADHLPCAGVAGLLKSVAREHDFANIKIVDLDPKQQADDLASYLLDELLIRDGQIEVGYAMGVRQSLISTPAMLAPSRQSLELGPEDVILVTGGARGITAEIARALARFGSLLILTGRTKLSDEESAETIACPSAHALRQALATGSMRDAPIAQIEQRCRELLAAREVQSTLHAIGAEGGRCVYYSVDLQDGSAVSDLVQYIYQQYGRLDGLVHGAGIIEDKLVSEKSIGSFRRVLETKAGSAIGLVAALGQDTRFVAFLASVSGVLGNRGQADYAAANDVLDKLAWVLQARPGMRALSVDWGPWGGTGMVSPSLARRYRDRGIELIAPDAGVRCFVQELLFGHAPQVLLSAPIRAERLTSPASAFV